MAQFPDAFGMSVTVEDMDAARRFYSDLFQKGEGNPLAPIFPTLKVDSVSAFEEKIKGLGGSVLIPSSLCPCTSTPFAVCVDVSGNQFMIKQPRER